MFMGKNRNFGVCRALVGFKRNCFTGNIAAYFFHIIWPVGDCMKIGLLGAFVFSGLISSLSFAQEQNQGQVQPVQVGRYQILDATLSAAPDSASKTFKRLVIVDTASGVLSVCDLAYRDSGKVKEGPEFWWTNGYCVPFVGQQGYQVPKNVNK